MKSIIEKLEKKKDWNIDINSKGSESRKANSLTYMIIFAFVSLFFIFALISVGLIFIVQWILGHYYQNVQIDNMFWVIYGIIFGVALSFFVQAIPSRKDKETPIEILKTFYHYFTYFFAFFWTIFLWITIAMFILAYVF